MSIYSELERVKTEGLADIFQFIKKSRSQRTGLVQEVVCSSVVMFLQNMQKKCQNMKTLYVYYNILVIYIYIY